MDKSNMSWLQGMFTNPIADAVLIVGIIAIIIVIAVLAKRGIFTLNIKGIQLGSSENERTIIRQQIEYCVSRVETFVESINYTETNRFRARYISELVLDTLVSAVAFNHISLDDTYVSVKVEKIWSQITKYSISPEYKSDEFKIKVENEVRDVIKHLVDIRKYYSK